MAAHTDTFSIGNVDALAQLLRQADEIDASTLSRAPEHTPAAIGPQELLDVKIPDPRPRSDAKAIWGHDEVTDGVDDDDDDDDVREKPEYEFVYKQAVQSTDAFLGMSGKDPSSTCCEDIVVKIHLPQAASAAGLDLDVKPTFLKLSSSIYKLSIHLPHKVLHERGSAKFDSDKKTLSVSLPIVRDFLEDLEKAGL